MWAAINKEVEEYAKNLDIAKDAISELLNEEKAVKDKQAEMSKEILKLEAKLNKEYDHKSKYDKAQRKAWHNNGINNLVNSFT